MTTTLLTKLGLIRASHSIRNEFSRWSTGNTCGCYYTTKGQAINVYAGVLQGYGLHLDSDDSVDWYGNEGRKMIAVHNESNTTVGYAVLSWYRMPSGNYEFLGYLT